MKYGSYFGIINNVSKKEIEAEFLVDDKKKICFFDFNGQLIPLKDFILNPILEIVD